MSPACFLLACHSLNHSPLLTQTHTLPPLPPPPQKKKKTNNKPSNPLTHTHIYIYTHIHTQGPTSAGKTTLVEYLAARTGHACVRVNNHEHTDVAEYLGQYAADPQTGRLCFVDGLLVRALREGHWCVGVGGWVGVSDGAAGSGVWMEGCRHAGSALAHTIAVDPQPTPRNTHTHPFASLPL